MAFKKIAVLVILTTVSMFCTVAKELPVADERGTGKGCSEAEQKKVVEALNLLLEGENIITYYILSTVFVLFCLVWFIGPSK